LHLIRPWGLFAVSKPPEHSSPAGSGSPKPPQAPSDARPAAPADKGASVVKKPPTLRQAWPIPLMLISGAMFVGGLVLAVASRPKPNAGMPLADVQQLLDESKYEDAIAKLNSDVLPLIDNGQPTIGQQRDFFLMRAQAFAGAQATLGIDREENNRLIIDDFERHEKLGGELSPTDISTLVSTQIRLDQIAEAMTRIEKLPEAERGRKSQLLREVVQHDLKMPDRQRREPRMLDTLARLATAPELSQADRAWVLARQSEMLLAAGRAEDAASKLVRGNIQRLTDISQEQQGELLLLLGKAYFLNEETDSAGRFLQAGEALLPEGSLLRADALVMLGRLSQAQGNLDEARERFAAVREGFDTSSAATRALLGLAEVNSAAQDNQDLQKISLEQYAELAEKVRRSEQHVGEISRSLVAASLMQRFRERFDGDKKADALRFVLLAESVYAEDDVSADVLQGIGRTRRWLGDQIMDAARKNGDPDFSVDDLDPSTRAEVKQHYLAAGEYLRKYARAVLAFDQASSSEALWLAADSFDRAGDLDEARLAFQQYAEGAPDTDPQRPAARFRLAQVFQARRDYAAAIGVYEELFESRSLAGAGGAGASGLWGERAIVPLAQSYLADEEALNDSKAEQLLLTVVDGRLLSPDASGYREALIELGTMYVKTGRTADAIARLEQAIERYPDDRRVETLRYRLADSHRQEAAAIRRTLSTQALPQTQVDELESLRVQHLRTGKAQFEQVRAALDARDRRKLTMMDKTYLRNAQFYAGDCAFDLGDFAGAIEAYDAARLRYAEDPASLVAMVQIVASYAAQGRLAEARTANERARQQLARFPEEVWARPDLPMEKRHWERWLEARTELDQRARASEAE
jgi:tetratricopeptide (TPR) repeat protein